VQFSVRENLLSVVGEPQSKKMQDMLPDILKQVGPQQYGFLKDLIDKSGAGKGADEDDVPPLVDGGNFESAAK
jgi:nascent polypeptide-associated complex subunit beta